MNIPSIDLLFWNSIVFLYFSFKNVVFSKLFRGIKLNVHPLVTIVLAISALFVNSLLLQDYNQYLTMSVVRGAIQLPPFTLLFLIADFLSSMLLLGLAIKMGKSLNNNPNSRTFIDIFRLICISIVFTTIASNLWEGEIKKQINWNYECFKNQLTVDLAAYYYRNQLLPKSIEDFTKLIINPINNSELIYSQGDTLTVSISDKSGNKIVEGYKDLLGIKSSLDNPSSFFSKFKIINDTLCKNSITIAPEYNQ